MINDLFVEGSLNGEPMFINLRQIWTITNVRQGFCKVWFNEIQYLDLSGDGADQLVTYVRRHLADLGSDPTAQKPEVSALKAVQGS